MKKLLAAACLLLSFQASAQITLEHTYSGNWRMEAVNVEGEGYKYIGINDATKQVEIYNADHSLFKTINTNIPLTSSVYTLPTYASKTLFNSDSKLEVVVMYSDAPAFKIDVINEDGTTLISIPNAAWYDMKKFGNAWKLLVHNAGSVQHTAVYSLPGQWVGTAIKPSPDEDNSLSSMIYPNPVNTSAVIRYSLPAGVQFGQLQVYNAQGILVRSFTISNQYSDIQLERESLPAGMYTYSVQAQGQNISTNKFVVQ